MTQCQQCATPLQQPLPRFCPQCGSPTAPARAPAGLDPAAAWASHKPYFMATGFFVLGFLTGGGPAFIQLGLVWMVAIPLIVLDLLNPPFMAQVPAFLRRPILGAAISLLALISVAVPAGLSLGWFLVAGGTWMWLKEALRRGEVTIGPLDLRLAWYGWRRWLLVGMLLASFTFAASWEPVTSVMSQRDYTVGSTAYRETSWFRYGERSGLGTGAATLPALVLTGVLVWAAWRGQNGVVPTWHRFVPAASTPLLIILAVRHMGTPDWVKQYSDVAYAIPATGPYLFVFLLVPFYVAAAMLARGRN